MEPKIRIDNASFSFGTKTVWSGLELDIHAGQAVCLLGPNGCGKTTLLNCMHGIYPPDSGAILLEGRPVHRMRPRELARKMGYVFQEHTAPFTYLVLEVIRMGRAPHLGPFESPSSRDTDKAVAIMESIGIAHLKDKRYTEISGGERQLVLIARALAQEPEIILLDEPTSHLDLRNQALILGMINHLVRRGLTVVMTSHFPNHALFLSCRVALMSRGGIKAVGDTREVMTEENLSRIYGLRVSMYAVDDPRRGGRVRFCIPWIETPRGVDRDPFRTNTQYAG